MSSTILESLLRTWYVYLSPHTCRFIIVMDCFTTQDGYSRVTLLEQNVKVVEMCCSDGLFSQGSAVFATKLGKHTMIELQVKPPPTLVGVPSIICKKSPSSSYAILAWSPEIDASMPNTVPFESCENAIVLVCLRPRVAPSLPTKKRLPCTRYTLTFCPANTACHRHGRCQVHRVHTRQPV